MSKNNNHQKSAQLAGASKDATQPVIILKGTVPPVPPQPAVRTQTMDNVFLLAHLCSSNEDFPLEKMKRDVECFFHAVFKWKCDEEFGKKARFIGAKASVVKTKDLELSDCSPTYNAYVEQCKQLGRAWSINLELFCENFKPLVDKEIEDEL